MQRDTSRPLLFALQGVQGRDTILGLGINPFLFEITISIFHSGVIDRISLRCFQIEKNIQFLHLEENLDEN